MGVSLSALTEIHSPQHAVRMKLNLKLLTCLTF